ncbi:MAG: ribosome silencing factor [Treponema sp.]|jgi:ribosome-associated protein|nr:ribosome silencing factor [Treponema sp.]
MECLQGVQSAQSDDIDQITAVDISRLLAEHKGNEVVALDLRGLDAWTDFFIIAGVTSSIHMQGLERQVKEFCYTRDIEIVRTSTTPATIDEEWKLIDLGTIVVHLMTEKARFFYELERLWSQAKTIPL